MAYKRYEIGSTNRSVVESIAFPAVAGTITTGLVYMLWPRSGDGDTREFNQAVPRLGFVPTSDGGRFALNWSF